MNQPDGFTGNDGSDIEIPRGPGGRIFSRDRAEVLQQFDLAPDPAPRVIVDQTAAVEGRRPDIVPRQVEDDASNAAAAGRRTDALLGFVGTLAFQAGVKARADAPPPTP